LVEAHRGQVAYRNAYFTIYRLHPGLARKALRESGRLPATSAAPWRDAAALATE